MLNPWERRDAEKHLSELWVHSKPSLKKIPPVSTGTRKLLCGTKLLYASFSMYFLSHTFTICEMMHMPRLMRCVNRVCASKQVAWVLFLYFVR